jgi:hypothetical protein
MVVLHASKKDQRAAQQGRTRRELPTRRISTLEPNSGRCCTFDGKMIRGDGGNM